MNEQEVRDYLESHGKQWLDFEDWMQGQTVGINSDESIDYYKWDVERVCEK